MTEGYVRKTCIRLAQHWGLLHKRLHFGKGAATGWPDDVFIFHNGTTLWVEFKSATGKTSKRQDLVIDKLRQRNCHVAVINDPADFEDLVATLYEMDQAE